MDELVLVDGRLTVPEEFQVRSGLVITLPWRKEVHNGRVAQVYYRHRRLGDKPYLPDGFVEFKKFKGEIKRYKVVEKTEDENGK